MTDSSSSFPGSGSLPQRLRKILYPSLTDHEVESIVVCLMAHLLIENSINGLLYRWLKRDAPIGVNPATGVNPAIIKAAEEKLWKNVTNMDFAKKYSLIEPFFSLHYPKEADNAWKLNNLRNDIFHGRAIKEAQFDGISISEEQAIEKIFLAAQSTSRSLDKFDEMLDAPHAYAERWRKRLEELNEPLL